MEIYIDAQPLIGPKTGIGNYTNNLVNEYASMGLACNLVTNQLVNVGKLSDLKKLEQKYNNIQVMNKFYPYKAIRKLSKNNFFYKYPIDLGAMLSKSPSVYHATNFITLPTIKAKQVLTIHDLAFMKFPEVVEQNIYEYMMTWVPLSVAKADQIIADSIQTKLDILHFFDVPEDKISVVYLAADKRFEKQDKHLIRRVKEKYQFPEKYLLFLGTLEPKKNLTTLLDVLSLLKKKYGIEEKLVVVGIKGWKFNPIFDKLQQLNLEEEVIFTGYIDDEDIPAIYSGASVFTFPSLYEGFGLPLLEAMQCETPVIAANTSCIPEVVGEAGILVDPFNVEEWAIQIYKVVTDEGLQKDLIAKGKKQASLFSWDKVANETIAVYKKALKG